MSSITLQSTLPLLNGKAIPVLGLGVWKMREGEETEEAVKSALAVGYRHIDTAKLYGNEESVGNAVRASGIPREDIFVTTKLMPTEFLDPEGGFTSSLQTLNIDYIDLYLIHWPAPIMPKNIWQTLERIYEQGLTKAIGVSNYDQSDIEKLLTYAHVPPMVNQVEFNPTTHDFDVLKFCELHNIVVEAYSPLGRGGLLNNSSVLSLASRYKKTPAQILIRWTLQHGTVSIPKSSNPERIKQNADVFNFELSPSDMDTLNVLT